jgi:hypothetical protein
MRVVFSLLADAANVSVEGKLNLAGEYNSVYAPQLPALLVSTMMVVRLEAAAGDGGDHIVTVQIIAPDGQTMLAQAAQAFQFAAENPGPLPQRFNLFSTLQGLLLPSHGRYELRVAVDGQVLDVTAFLVQPTAAAQ